MEPSPTSMKPAQCRFGAWDVAADPACGQRFYGKSGSLHFIEHGYGLLRLFPLWLRLMLGLQFLQKQGQAVRMKRIMAILRAKVPIKTELFCIRDPCRLIYFYCFVCVSYVYLPFIVTLARSRLTVSYASFSRSGFNARPMR